MAKQTAASKIAGLIILGAVAYGYYLSRPEPVPLTAAEQAAQDAKDAAEEAQRKMVDAMIRCENQTKDQLADPDGFDPQGWGDWLATEASEDRYVYVFSARAKNAYGALVWGNFMCEVTFDGKYWRAEISQP